MKKIFIVLLFAAVGAGIYFYFSTKSRTSISNSKELIIGIWKVDSLTARKDTSTIARRFFHAFDSSLGSYEFDFTKDGSIYNEYRGRIEDTSSYQFVDNSTFLISGKYDTVKHTWNIIKLDSSIMRVTGEDSLVLSFSKVGRKNQNR